MAAGSTEEMLYQAYAFVRGVEKNRSIAAVTLDHLLQEQIEAIEGGGSRALIDAAGARTSAIRPSKLDQLDAVEKAVEKAVSFIESEGA